MPKFFALFLLAVFAWPVAAGAAETAPTVNELIRNLRAADAEQRVEAAEALAALGPAAAPAVRALIAALDDVDDEVQSVALLALQLIGRGAREAVPALIEILKSEDSSKFGGAIETLGVIGSEAFKAKPDLLGFMLGEDQLLSVTACRALVRILPPDHKDLRQVIPVLVQALKADDPLVRDEAIATLGSTAPLAVAQLVKLVAAYARDPELAARAAAALALMGPNAAPAAQALGQALESDHEAVVMQAAVALSKIGPAAQPAIPQLKELLSVKRPVICMAALRTLGDIGPGSVAAVGDIAALLADRDENIRFESARALGKIGPSSQPAILDLTKALADESEKVKWEAVGALGRIGAKAVSQLIATLDDDTRRDAAVVALGHIGPAARLAVPKLVKLLSQPKLAAELGSDVVMALSQIGPAAAEAVPTLLEILADEQSPRRSYAAWAVAQIGARSAIDPLFEALNHNQNPNSELATVVPLAILTLNPDDDDDFIAAATRVLELLDHESSLVKQAAAAALASVGKKAAFAVPVLAAGLKDPDPEVRGAYLSTLAAIGPDAEAALPAVILALADPVYPVRYSASYAVGKIGPTAKVTAPLLEQNLQDRDPLLRFVSAWALLQVDPQRSDLASLCTGPLRWGLKYANSRLRTEAAQALGSLGPDAAGAVPDLEAVAKDADEIVRQTATEALRKISQLKPNPHGFFERVRGNRERESK